MRLSKLGKASLTWVTVLSVGLIGNATKLSAQEVTARIYCGSHYDKESDTNFPATIHEISDQKRVLVIWTEDNFPNPQQRCESVSPRFQEAQDKGSLDYITNGTMSGQPVICTQKEIAQSCETLLMTLTPEDNSVKILNALKDQLNGQTVGPVKHNSAVPQIFIQIDIEELIQQPTPES